MQAWGIHLPAPVCQQEQLLEQQGELPALALPAGCAGGAKHPPGLFCFPEPPEDPRAGLRAGRFMGEGEGWGNRGRMSGCLWWGQSLFSGGLVLSFGVSVSAQLLPFNTRDGHRAHKILTWSRTLKATGVGNCWPF